MVSFENGGFYSALNKTRVMLKKKYIQWPWLIILLATPVVLWLLPSGFFDGEGGIIVCPSRLFFGVECWSCGMTRAVMHLHHAELSDAIYYNAGVVVVYPALVVIWFLWVKSAISEVRKPSGPAGEMPQQQKAA